MIWRTPSSSLAPPDRWAGCWSSSGISTRGSRHLWPSGTRCAAGWRTVAPRAWCPWITGSRPSTRSRPPWMTPPSSAWSTRPRPTWSRSWPASAASCGARPRLPDGQDVAEHVVLAQLAVRFAVRLEHVAHDLPDGVRPGELDDLLQRPGRGVRRPGLLVIGVAEAGRDLAAAGDGKARLLQQALDHARIADRQRRGRAGRGRGERAQPGEQRLGLAAGGIAPHPDGGGPARAADPRQLAHGRGRVGDVLDGVERGDHVEAGVAVGQRLDLPGPQVGVRGAVAGHPEQRGARVNSSHPSISYA